jgi:MtfA peptidase
MWDKILVATSAVIPVLGFEEWYCTNLSDILLFPDYFYEELEFDSKGQLKIIGGLLGNGRFEKQMILSKKALYPGYADTTDKNTTGVHEIVQLIDKIDGVTDGIPERLLKHQYEIL